MQWQTAEVLLVVVEGGGRIGPTRIRSREGGTERAHLEAEAGLAPVPPLGVVPIEKGQYLMLWWRGLNHPAVPLIESLAWPGHCSLPSRGLDLAVALVVEGGDLVPNGVASAQPDPLGDGPVLLLGLGQLLLGLESLEALLGGEQVVSNCSLSWRPSRPRIPHTGGP
ncbi:hypothetical protein VTJ49DRAFT_2999 [Mycothermus thermophilus]|uniref:Uncharacterized protein n=1 Tax=Humicola insolens TaxID=85995 RepID=A0ABR3V8K4_HUMIN